MEATTLMLPSHELPRLPSSIDLSPFCGGPRDINAKHVGLKTFCGFGCSYNCGHSHLCELNITAEYLGATIWIPSSIPD